MPKHSSDDTTTDTSTAAEKRHRRSSGKKPGQLSSHTFKKIVRHGCKRMAEHHRVIRKTAARAGLPQEVKQAVLASSAYLCPAKSSDRPTTTLKTQHNILVSMVKSFCDSGRAGVAFHHIYPAVEKHCAQLVVAASKEKSGKTHRQAARETHLA